MADLTTKPESRLRPRAVTFILPGTGTIPAGGFRVVYEYANGLADRGWIVRIVHPRNLDFGKLGSEQTSFARRTRSWIGYHLSRITGNYRPDRWFQVSPKVELLCTKTPDVRYIPRSDFCIATAWGTAPWVATYPCVGLYLIQHLETWCGAESDVMATWRLPLRKVVISRWLEDIARGLGESACYIPNGLNFRVFGMDVKQEQRDPHSLAMLHHPADWKGSADGIRAICTAKAKIPKLRALVFGVLPRPSELPGWIDYYHDPSQSELRRIYNRAAIFVSPSWAEGWALPPAEALQCGTALAATDIGGHREYAIQGETALLSPSKNPDALAENVVRLLEDSEMRFRLAHQGHIHIQQFTWERAVASFESVLNDGPIESCGSDTLMHSKIA